LSQEDAEKKSYLEQHSQFITPPWNMHESVLLGHLRFGFDTFFEIHQTLIVLFRLVHPSFVVCLRVFVSFASGKATMHSLSKKNRSEVRQVRIRTRRESVDLLRRMEVRCS